LDAYYITQTLNYNFAICDKMFMIQVIKHFFVGIINILSIIIHSLFHLVIDIMLYTCPDITLQKCTKSGTKQVCVVICAQGYNITISFR